MDILIIISVVAGAIIGIALIVSIIGSYSIQKKILTEIQTGKALFSVVGAAAEQQQYVPAPALDAPIPNRNEVIAIAAPCIAEVMGKDVSGLRIVSIKRVG